MKIDFYKEKERLLTLAREYISDAIDSLEEYLPDMAGELRWISENLLSEILSVRSAVGSLADGEDPDGAFA